MPIMQRNYAHACLSNNFAASGRDRKWMHVCRCIMRAEWGEGRGVIKYIYTFTDTQKYWQHMLSQKYEYSFCYTCTGAPFFPPASMRMFSTPPPPSSPSHQHTQVDPSDPWFPLSHNYYKLHTLPSSSSISLLHPSPFLILSLA